MDPGDEWLSIRTQCELLGLPRSTWYYQAKPSDSEDLRIKRLIDEKYTARPSFGVRRMWVWLRIDCQEVINIKRVRRLMREMGLEALFQKPNLSRSNTQHKKYPYLLRGLAITRPNQVWCVDITYLRLTEGFVYLVAIMDWHSRYVLAWELSVTLDVGFCLEALDRALQIAKPEIFNSDQGVQFTCIDFTGRLEAEQIQISMDGKGRALDNVMIERFWRTLKYEEVYL
ncbi:MAG: IS3 family transposase, partial [Candidatus Dormibacteraceae bacterium]